MKRLLLVAAILSAGCIGDDPQMKKKFAAVQTEMNMAQLNDWPKRCGTCGRHYNLFEWQKLPLACNRNAPTGEYDDGEHVLEFRNCTCGSTLAVIKGPSQNQKPQD